MSIKKDRGCIIWKFVLASFLLIIIAIILPSCLQHSDNDTDSSVADATELTQDTIEDVEKNNGDTQIPIHANESTVQLNGADLEYIVGSSVSIDSGASSEPPAFEFGSGFAVKAKVVKNIPDVYCKLDVKSEYRPTSYRLIQMETIDVINGLNVPQHFLYLIPEYVFVDMSVYDSLIISMTQLGVQNYVLKNITQNRIESFELPIFADVQDNPELGNIIAFSDGVFDESLWQNESWIYGYEFAEQYLDNYDDCLVVSRGDSESEVISAIQEQYREWFGENIKTPTVTTLNFTSQAAKDVLEYVKPFANGVFSQRLEPYYGNGQLIFRRFINGCQTEEVITIDLLTEEVIYSDVKYTKEEMMQMENISVHLSEKVKEYADNQPVPPHIDPRGKVLLSLNLYAWYVKADGNLYGVIKTAWRYKAQSTYYIQYYDDAYTLYDLSTGESINISRDDLVRTVGSRNVYLGEYGNKIDIPM